MSAPEQGADPFDSKAKTWDQKAWIREATAASARALKDSDLLGPSFTVLELGCGTGLLAETLADSTEVGLWVGVDTSQGMAAEFQKKADARSDGKLRCVRTQLTDAGSLRRACNTGSGGGCDDSGGSDGGGNDDSGCSGSGGAQQLPDKFDLVVSLLTFHHVQDIPGMLQVLRQYVAPGGAIAIFDLMQTLQSLRFHNPERMSNVHHPGGFAPEQMEGYLQGAGFGDASARAVGTFNREAAAGPEEVLQFNLLMGSGKALG